MEISNIKDTLAEIAKMTDEERDTALRLSGESLAQIDGAMRTASAEELDQLASAMADMSLCHVDLMFRSGLYNDAYATAVMAMMTLSIYDKFNVNHLSTMGLCVVALYSLEQVAQRMTQDDETQDHVNHIIVYLISLTYSQYQQLVHDTQSIWLNRAYELLRDLRGHILPGDIPLTLTSAPEGHRDESNSSAPVQITVNPHHPLPLFQDIAGRSVALSLLN